MFATSRDQLRQLGYMSAAVQQQPHLQPLLRKMLNCMQVIRSCVNDELRDPSKDISNVISLCRKKVDALMIEFQSVMDQDCPSAEYFEEKRKESIENDLKAVACKDPMKEKMLRDAILYLRQLEETREFHASLLSAQEDLTTYPISTYAYGTTSYLTMKSLLQLGPISQVLDNIYEDPHPDACTVFGSSTGSLVVYTALSQGIPVRGIEILPFLVDQSKKMTTRCKIDAPITFLLDDMLNVSLDNTKLLILASQCWDKDLWAKLLSKLQMINHSMVILDYTDRLSSETWCSHIATGFGAVSWNDHQEFNVYSIQQE
ncbi:hypothetical protein THRCLA_04527 [Thraustotheca clavata]|uniref:DOT1 domain-containing protein n=1 Tax=Thraustotheca clavata TaxID=74557 RepID=A0A1V9ZZI0_9STRA|nr:hypothetical protein THRCLA_04527 [Thraustotheca clavata]